MSRVLDGTTVAITAALLLFACQGSESSTPESMSAAGSEPPPPAAGVSGKGSAAAGTVAGSAGTGAPAAGKSAGAPAAGTSAAAGGKGGSPSQGSGGGGSPTPTAGAGGQGGSSSTTSEPDLQRSSMSANNAPSIADGDYQTFISHINKFGLDLGQQVSGGEYKTTNLIYSPLSATVALGMTYAGAKGQTASEMKTVLGDSFAAGVFHTATNRLVRELASRATSTSAPNGDTLKLELNLADAIFVDRTVTLQPAFLDVLSREYDSGVRRLDFIHAFEPARTTINDWVEEQTKDKIQDLLPMGSITDMTRLVLVNALYFYGSWATPFPHNATQDSPFRTLAGSSVQVPTMHIETRFSYAKADNYELAELPYLSGMRMTIVLPAEGQFEALRAQVSDTWLTQALAKLGPALLNVSLPKFKMTVGSFSLTAGLKALGMQQPFTDGADFSGIATGIPLSISDVVQKAFIAVDEKGTEAAAATGVIVGTTSVPVDPPIPFHVDRPFLFFIRDQNGAVLFSGHVVDPSK